MPLFLNERRANLIVDSKKELLRKLDGLGSNDIVFTHHAEIQSMVRQIDLGEVRKNLLNPHRLKYVEKQPSRKGETKYDCYFGYSKTQAHRYVIVINAKLVVVTIIKINRRWQRRIEKHGKK